ncbi:MarR family winged helix-turn-helix transcriptional regulator [Sphaerisporangium fuscum]|uniref:MarR family winged helix-turn-helix transcriptional regulator n=1 Tax=Sphaerisporangium fuscum TaxID=2835868 RepID=UPI001BDD5435|nr:MarR family winged helix-turn-helix transcriptional regulator [Sphaerisporangium fuscum]
MTDIAQLPPSLLGITPFLLSKTGLAGRRGMGERLESVGLGLWHLAVLAALADFGPSSQRDLGRRLGIDPSDLVAVMDTLLPRDLVVRDRDPADRRRYSVSISPAGREALAEALRLARQVRDDLLAGLDEDERETLHHLLRKAYAALDARAAYSPGTGIVPV